MFRFEEKSCQKLDRNTEIDRSIRIFAFCRVQKKIRKTWTILRLLKKQILKKE